MSINSYRDLWVWQESMTLVETCYRLTRSFPREELYGLTSQIRRAAVSVPANIAEGYGRNSHGSYIQFLRVSRGSLKELETHLLISARVDVTTTETIEPILVHCASLGRMMNRLIEAVEASDDRV